MKYFVVTSTIKDGEYEYLQQSPRRAMSEAGACKQVEKENEEWTRDDYREHEIDRVQEISKAEFETISKYVY